MMSRPAGFECQKPHAPTLWRDSLCSDPAEVGSGARRSMRRNCFRGFLLMMVVVRACASPDLRAQDKPEMKSEEMPLRVALAGLAHGHAFGFFDQFQKRADLQVVGIAEADGQLVAQFEKRFGLAHSLFHADLEEMLKKIKPPAVLAYTNTYDHLRVVEICARYGVPVMMEKPLAVSAGDGRAIKKAARAAKIKLSVNYATTWDRSNQTAYDLVHRKALGGSRKMVCPLG